MTNHVNYGAALVSAFQPTPTLTLLLNHHDASIVEVEPIVAAILRQCHGVRPLSAHLEVASQAGLSADAHVLSSAIDALVTLGLLRPQHPLSGCGVGSTGHTVDSVAIITADRPKSLSRGLTTLATNSASLTEVIVIDGSRIYHAETRSVVARYSQTTGLIARYLGTEAAGNLRHALEQRGIPRHVLEFGLTPGTIGANRNLAVLFTAGRTLMMQDDDIMSNSWAPDSRSEGIVLGGHADLRTWKFFRSRSEALDSTASAAIDVLHAHSRILRRTIAQLVSSESAPCDADVACSHMVAALATPSDQMVRVTFAGLAGDSARYCSHRVLFMGNKVREYLWSNSEALRISLSSREVTGIVERITVTHDPACMAYCMGVDNSTVLPPFIPVGRNEDGVWGATLGFMDPRALFAHLPLGVRHESNRGALYEELMPSARHTRICDFLLFVIAQVSRITFHADPIARAICLGDVLMQIGNLPIGEFMRILTEARLVGICADIAQQHSAAMHANCSHEWRTALNNYTVVFSQCVTGSEFFIPVEFNDASSVDTGFVRAQTFIYQFGELLRWWPEMWQIALMLGQERDWATSAG